MKRGLFSKIDRKLIILIAASLIFVHLPTIPVAADWSGWKDPDTASDNGWTNEDYIKDNDDDSATSTGLGSSYYIEGSNFPFNLPNNRYIKTLQVRVHVKHDGFFWQEDPEIYIGAYYDSAWHWYGPYTVHNYWEQKSQGYYKFIDPPNNIKVRVYISSNPDTVNVEVNYVECRVNHYPLLDFSELGHPESSYPGVGATSNLGTDWGRNPSDERVKSEALSIVYDACGSSPTAAEAAYALWEYVYEHFTYINISIKADYTIIENKQMGNYTGLCYNAAILLSGLARSLKIPARIILFDYLSDENEHVCVEFYLNDTEHNGWVTADGTGETGYGWYDWDDFSDYSNGRHWTKYPTLPESNLEYIRWVFKVNGDYRPQKWNDYDAIVKNYNNGSDSNWTTWDDYKDAFDW